MSMLMSGYQAGILYATGCISESKYLVRNVDRWYCDVVQPLFGTAVYAQSLPGREKPQYVVKGTSVTDIDLAAVSDWPGFCRAYIELKSSLDLWRPKAKSGGRGSPKPRLRIYGNADILEWIMAQLPAKPKKLQFIANRTQDGYTGQTCAIYYQSSSEIAEILDYISGYPRNEAVWARWTEIMSNGRASNG